MGIMMIFTGIGIICFAVILTVLFRIRKPVYQPENRHYDSRKSYSEDDPLIRITLPLNQNENQKK